MEIRDGDSHLSPMIGEKLCGTAYPNTIKTNGNKVYIKFSSDGSNTEQGFEIQVKQSKFILIELMSKK